jgi:hypothetical protein
MVFWEKSSNPKGGMITRSKNLVGPQTHPSNNTLANKIFTTIQANI